MRVLREVPMKILKPRDFQDAVRTVGNKQASHKAWNKAYEAIFDHNTALVSLLKRCQSAAKLWEKAQCVGKGDGCKCPCCVMHRLYADITDALKGQS